MRALRASARAKKGIRALIPLAVLLVLVAGSGTLGVSRGNASVGLTVTPLTWDTVGLDSNSPIATGPDRFPVGARVCNNTGGALATNTATFVWDTTPAPNYINLQTSSTISLPDLGIGECADAYYTVQITRSASAYDFTRRYHIAFSLGGGAQTASTPTPRQLYIEHLVSQNRNSTNAISGSGGCPNAPSNYTGCDPVPTRWIVGQTYTVKLYATTSTVYPEINAFLNFTGSVFRVVSASSTYSKVTAPASSSSISLWNDACSLVEDPTNVNYKSCTTAGAAGNSVVVTYRVKALTVAAAATIVPLINDFSGSSYHYNSDYNSAPITISVGVEWPLTVSKTGTGTGTVTSNVGVVNCGVTCSDSYTDGTSVTLTATPTGGSTFSGWTGCDSNPTPTTCVVSMTAAKNVTAQFDAGAVPNLVVTKSHTGDFSQGDVGDTYTLTVTNSGLVATDGVKVATVVDTLPTGLTATAISGSGWSCTLATLTCTRNDALTAIGELPAYHRDGQRRL